MVKVVGRVRGVIREAAVRETAWRFEWSFATWLEILSNLRLHITWQQRLQIQPACSSDGECMDDYNIVVHERCTFVYAVELRTTKNPDDQNHLLPLFFLFLFLFRFQTMPRAILPKPRILARSFYSRWSPWKRRVSVFSCDPRVTTFQRSSLLPSFRWPSLKIERANQTEHRFSTKQLRCLERTSRTWLETLASLRLPITRDQKHDVRAPNARPRLLDFWPMKTIEGTGTTTTTTGSLLCRETRKPCTSGRRRRLR